MNVAFASYIDSKKNRNSYFHRWSYGFWSYKKQKCVTKSPTKSELVALMDHIGFVDSFAELFLRFIVSENIENPNNLQIQYTHYFVSDEGRRNCSNETYMCSHEPSSRSDGKQQDQSGIHSYFEHAS